MRSTAARLAALLFLGLLLSPAMSISAVDSAPGGCAPLKKIRVLGDITVGEQQVSLLQICDPKTLPDKWKSIMGALNIGSAPSVGSEKFIDPGQLRSYLIGLLNSHGIDPSKVELDIPKEILVKRKSTRVTQQWLEKIFTKYVLKNSSWNKENIKIEKVRFSGIPVVPTGKLTYDISSSFSPERRLVGNVSVTVNLYVDGEKARMLYVEGSVELFANVYMASRPLKRNEILTAADVEQRRMNITDYVDSFATRLDQVVNRRALCDIGEHEPLELKELDRPLVVKRGDPVKIVFEAPGLSVSAIGRARADAGIGDTLPVINVSSKKIVYCKVLNSQTVTATY